MAKSREILRRKTQYSDPLSASVEDIFAEIENEIEHKDEIEVLDRNGKKVVVFNDPLYSREPRSTVNYSIFRGKWEFEPLEDIDENEVHVKEIKTKYIGVVRNIIHINNSCRN